MMALGDQLLAAKACNIQGNLKTKIEKANKDLSELNLGFKTN